MEKMILENIKKGNLKTRADVLAAVVGYLKGKGETAVSFELIEWIDGLYADCKID